MQKLQKYGTLLLVKNLAFPISEVYNPEFQKETSPFWSFEKETQEKHAKQKHF